MHNFIADVRNGGDFSKSYWTKRSRKQVAFFHVRTVKHLHLQTAGVKISFKTLGLSRLSRILSYGAIQVIARAWLHEPGWLALPRWLLSRYYMNQASPVPPSLIHIINVTYALYNDAKIYATAASCLLDQNKPRLTNQDKVLVASANTRPDVLLRWPQQ